MSRNKRIKYLEEYLEKYNHLYRIGAETISDTLFDWTYNYYRILCGVLRERPEFELLRENIRSKLRHSFNIGSVRKRTEDTCLDWALDNGRCVLELKIDGVGLSIEKYGNDRVRALTRGDGTHGEDLSIPVRRYFSKNLSHFNGIIRGELFISIPDFKKYLEFTSPRHYVAGTINKKLFDWKDIRVAIYDLIDGKGSIVYDNRFFRLPYLDFHSNREYTNLNILRLKHLGRLLPADGIVVKRIDEDYVVRNGYRRDALCWKFDNYVPQLTRVIGIDWGIGRTGKVTPIVLLRPIRLNNKLVSKVTGSNIQLLRNKGIGLCAVVEVKESGMTIPQLGRVIIRSGYGLNRSRCQFCKGILAMELGSLRCSNGTCSGRLNSYLNFIFGRRILNIDNLSSKRAMLILKGWNITLRYLADAGFCHYMNNRFIGNKIALKINVSFDSKIDLPLTIWLMLLNLNGINHAWAKKLSDYCDNNLLNFQSLIEGKDIDIKLPKNVRSSLNELRIDDMNWRWFTLIWRRFNG